jgi:hypothetical protein
MALTVNTVSYDQDGSTGLDHQRYSSATHTADNNDYIDCKRSKSKPTADFAGVTRGSFKITRTTTDGSVDLGNGILEISVSFPVGSQASEMQAFLDDAGSWLATAEADDVLISQKINQ